MLKNRLAGLLLILFLSLSLRLTWLAKYPTGFSADEAAFGYNSYSLLLTGKDEWATPFYQLPVTNLKSFGDYKVPLYAFLAAPTIRLFGLTEVAVRLPNAVFGSLSVVAIWLLAYRLFSSRTAILAGGIAAISPWSISLSRGGFEANLITLFLPLAITAWISRRYTLSAIVLGINFYSYHSARFLSLMTWPLLVAFYKPARAVWIKNAFLVFLLFLPGLLSFLGPGRARIADVGIFHPTDNWQSVADRRFEARNVGLPDSLARVFSNKVTSTVSTFARNYFTYLSPQFLFTSGAVEASHGMITGRGVLYYVELPLLLAFLVWAIRRPTKTPLFLLLLLLAAPLPAALSKGTGYATNRAVIMQPWLMIMASAGVIYLVHHLPRIRSVLAVGLILFYLIGFAGFVEGYLYHAPRVNASAMHYGWREVVERMRPIADGYSQVRVSRALSEPHIFLAFYLRFPPREYQEATRGWPSLTQLGLPFLDQYDGYYLAKYRFGDTNRSDVVSQPTLYIIPDSSFPPDYPEFFHVDYPTGKTAIRVVELLPQ